MQDGRAIPNPPVVMPTSPESSIATPCVFDSDCITNPRLFCGINGNCTSLLPDDSPCSSSLVCQRGCLDTGTCGSLPAAAACTYDFECNSFLCEVRAIRKQETALLAMYWVCFQIAAYRKGVDLKPIHVWIVLLCQRSRAAH